MPRCKRCHRHIREGEYGRVCAKKTLKAEQKELNFDPVIDPTKSLREQHEKVCQILNIR